MALKNKSNKAQPDPTGVTIRRHASSSHPKPSSALKPSIKQIMAARSKTLSLLALFIGILCLYFPVTTTAAVAKSGAAVDLLYLTLVWPGTFCYSGQCCMPTTGEPANDFLIEDLKTLDQTGQIVQDCNSTCRFSVNKDPMPSLIP
ncbi:extracellular ribonuclease LE-like [Dioscorea cayenensis subsp. rotundata]|uniref:Extracellular ribonuclease LE-like n=1 Tax=Dioscorea cayennensis subsp. rotundata TaxID=55577 RepID=A0AB40BG79_DIOCR|nr:extracellular ribonuclease LE-like [Dioscorea cayenensis subsp. rotundata]